MPSLYANYLDPKAATSSSSPATISSEPVKYSFKEQQEAVRQEKKAPDGRILSPIHVDQAHSFFCFTQFQPLCVSSL